jgi:pimeloyl-ACP methyl ester carboxylesterase
MQISTHSSLLNRHDPTRWTRGEDRFTLKGAVAAAGLAAYSQAAETLYYTGLAVEALSSDSPLPLGEQIHRLDVMRRAIKAHRRVHLTENLPLGPANPLKELPVAQVQRPVMLVPGWDTPHDRFRPLTDKLTEGGANGGHTYYVKDGQFYSDQDCNFALASDQIPADAKVFVTVLHSTSESPHTSAPQIRANLEAIGRLRPGPVPDVIAYSQGGLATRQYLNSGEDARVGRLMFVGTPNLGAGLASLSNFVYQAQDKGYNVDYLLADQNLDSEDRDSIEFMTVGSEPLQRLNAGWEQQMARTEGYAVVGSQQTPTFHYGFPPIKPGDRLVPAENLAPPGVAPTFVEGQYSEHATLPFHPDVYREMLNYFCWA